MKYIKTLFYKNNDFLQATFKFLFFLFFSTHPLLKLRIKKALKNSKNHELFFFVHLPKTGGTYLNSRIENLPVVNLNHSLFRKSKFSTSVPIGLSYIYENRLKKIKPKTIFTIVRDPITFFVSYWNHVTGSTEEHYSSKYYNKKHYDLDISRKGFKNFVHEIITRDSSKYPSKSFLYPQIFNSNGKLIVDYIFHNKNLDVQLVNFFNEKGYLFKPGKRQRSSPTNQHITFYTDEMKALIKKTYYREYFLFKLLENHSKPIYLVTEDLKYNYKTDELFYRGKLL